MTDHYIASCGVKPRQELDEDLVGAGLVLVVFGAGVLGAVIASGLWPYALSMAAGAWLQKRFGRRR